MPIETQSAEQNDHHWGSLQYINSPDDARDDDDRKRPNRIVAKAERNKQESETAREFSELVRPNGQRLQKFKWTRTERSRKRSGTRWKLAAVCLAAYWCHACA